MKVLETWWNTNIYSSLEKQGGAVAPRNIYRSICIKKKLII